MNKILYCDANAHLPLNSKAAQAYVDFSNSVAGHGHPSALSRPGRLAATAIEEARAKIAQLIGAVSPNQIIFTSGCSQACDWGLKIFLEFAGNDEEHLAQIAFSSVEHPAVNKICEERNIQQLDVSSDGVTILPSVPIKRIICVHVQNEIGTIQPIKELGAEYLFSDMSQSLGKIPLNITELGVDVATFSSHKFGGPSGCGFMYLKNTDWWMPYNEQIPRYMDMPGTPNTAGIIASAIALEEAINTLPIRIEKMESFQTTLEFGLLDMGFEIIGRNVPRSNGTTYLAGLKFAQKTLLDLEDKGIYVGTGSACSSYSSPNTVPLMGALGKDYHLENVLRISQFGDYDNRDAEYFIKTLREIL